MTNSVRRKNTATSSGERFDMFFAHTAAHRELPFGTWLLVTHTDRELMVRVNDRGPFIGERFLDLAMPRAAGLEALKALTPTSCTTR